MNPHTEAKKILEDQANELAHWIEFTPEGKATPSLVKRAVRLEINRIRGIANAICPKTESIPE